MRYLLDTHCLIWFLLGEQKKFSPKIIDCLLDEQNAIYFSTVSMWEMAIKYAKNPRDFPYPPQIIAKELQAIGFQHLPIKIEHTFAVMNLPSIHKDPFDRLLICQAGNENMLLITADEKILQYPNSFILNVH